MQTLNQCKSLINRYLAPILLLGSISACAGSENAGIQGSTDVQKATIEEMYEGYKGDFPNIDAVWPADIAEAYAADELILVDVRENDEQAVSMIPGAISKEKFEQGKDAYADKRVIVLCTIGYRSGVYVKELAEQGFKAENLAGSILMWAHEGLPLEDSDGQPTKQVHIYGKKWDLLPEGYKGTW
jgi:rhodanese-related sulfurtransferase